MAYYLAIEATKKEIAKLYNAALAVSVSTKKLKRQTLNNVFTLNPVQLLKAGITWQPLTSKQ